MLDDIRGAGAFAATGGGGREGTTAHLFKQPQLSRGNENFHLCRSCTPNPFHFLAGSLTISCFHSWLQDRLSLPICTSRPAQNQIQIPQLVQVEQ